MLGNLLTSLLHADDHIADLLGNGPNLLWDDKSLARLRASEHCLSLRFYDKLRREALATLA